ncbi:hypothetical protein [Stenotrophomonas sp. SY1]|uniref:hypothetical protein n=1 Tax=Stenotrophomonas sp. SY1 TaxID=477235 RepID=UPI001E612234|nr:hypothetical protein [Stenotrophomonas sp. SY1]MCD9086252.1 hypothetical protein [Stenotrophomonas sp. SY1]
MRRKRQRAEHGREALGDRLRLYSRWWVARGWSSPRAWRWIGLGVLLLAVVLVIFRQPLADRLWPETRIQQLLDEGQRALQQGRLSASDGSGARELFQAAAALDPDRSDVQNALVRTGQAALERARRQLAAGDHDGAAVALELARQLQVSATDIEQVAATAQRAASDRDGLEQLLQQAEAAQAQGRLDDGPDSALPLYQRVLALQPDRMRALAGRDEVLSDLLAQANDEIAQGKLADAVATVQRVESYDGGHADLPPTKAALNAALDQRMQQAERDLARGRLERATTGFQQVLAVNDNTAAWQGLQRIARARAQEATRLAADFHFEQAEQALSHARELAPDSADVASASQALLRARAARQSMEAGLAPAARERRLKELLAKLEVAEARQQWLLPPGSSAYDHFKAAQALAPQDARVKRAAARIQPAARSCLEENLRGNRLRAARGCLDAWQALAPADPALAPARRRLAQRWIAVGSERLGMGDTAFAQQALEQAQEVDGTAPEIGAFAERVRAAIP